MELFMLLLGLVVGLVVGAVWTCRRLAGKENMSEAIRAVVMSGPGPWRPPQ